MATKYAMAMKHNPASPGACRLSEQPHAFPGVTVEGHTSRSAQFSATPEGLAQVRAVFSPSFLIEEVRDRNLI